MNNKTTISKEIFNPEYLFKQPFLSKFFVYRDKLGLKDDNLKELDKLAASYEKREIDQKSLQSLKRHNDILFSYAVSKAESSQLTMAEAEDVYRLVISGQSQDDLSFLKNKLAKGEKLTKSGHDRLEYRNIISAIKKIEKLTISLKDIDLDFIISLHKDLTTGLDIFDGHLLDFEPYHSGILRQDDKTRIGDKSPAPYSEIKDSVNELLAWLKKNPTTENVFIFHAALYAVHPFSNGNKRVCRILEHLILRLIGYNASGLYTPSYYYHKHKDRYYKQLLETLHCYNLSYFSSFSAEALFFSILGVITGALQRKKFNFLERSGLDNNIIKILKPLIKNKELKFGRLLALNKRKVSKQTLVNYLAETSPVINKRQQGKNVYYSLRGEYFEEELITQQVALARDRGMFIPNEFLGYQ